MRIIGLGLLFVSAVAAGHKEEFPKRDALLIEPGRLTLTVQYVVPASEEAEVLRHLFDRDRSGQLEGAELDALRSYLSTQASAFVKLALDGKALQLKQEQIELGPIPIDARREALSAVLTLSLPLSLSPGRHQLRFSDRHKDRRVQVPLRISGRGLRVRSNLPPLPLLDEGHVAELELEVTPAP